jgi:hypothetical protein
VDLAAVVWLVHHPAEHITEHVSAGADQARLAELEHIDEHVVVPGVDLEAVDLRQVGGVGLLHTDDVLDLRQLAKELVRQILAGALRDVVEQDRQVRCAIDLLVVAHQSAEARPVVVRVDRQQRVGPELGGAFGQLDGVARVVRPHARDDRAPPAHLFDSELDEPEVLLVVHRRRLARRATDHQPLRAVLDQVVHQPHGRLLVDAPGRVEGRDHRGQDRAEIRAHRAIISDSCSRTGKRLLTLARAADQRAAIRAWLRSGLATRQREAEDRPLHHPELRVKWA